MLIVIIITINLVILKIDPILRIIKNKEQNIKSYKIYFDYYKTLIVLQFFKDETRFQSEYDTVQDLGLEETNYEEITNMLTNDLELFKNNLLLDNLINQTIKAYE